MSRNPSQKRQKSRGSSTADRQSRNIDLVKSSTKLVIVMVGMPARGKSYMAKKIFRYMRHLKLITKVFNLGSYRRVATKDITVGQISADFFDPSNQKNVNLREQCCIDAMKDLTRWLKDGGQVAILDGTNSTQARRELIRGFFREVSYEAEFDLEHMYVESLCEDDNIIHQNIIKAKLSNPDYVTVNPQQAIVDFKKRIKMYEQQYAKVEAREGSYIKVINVGNEIQGHALQNYLQTRIMYFLSHLHLHHTMVANRIAPAAVVMGRSKGSKAHPLAALFKNKQEKDGKDDTVAKATKSVIESTGIKTNAAQPIYSMEPWMRRQSFLLWHESENTYDAEHKNLGTAGKGPAILHVEAQSDTSRSPSNTSQATPDTTPTLVSVVSPITPLSLDNLKGSSLQILREKKDKQMSPQHISPLLGPQTPSKLRTPFGTSPPQSMTSPAMETPPNLSWDKTGDMTPPTDLPPPAQTPTMQLMRQASFAAVRSVKTHAHTFVNPSLSTPRRSKVYPKVYPSNTSQSRNRSSTTDVPVKKKPEPQRTDLLGSRFRVRRKNTLIAKISTRALYVPGANSPTLALAASLSNTSLPEDNESDEIEFLDNTPKSKHSNAIPGFENLKQSEDLSDDSSYESSEEVFIESLPINRAKSTPNHPKPKPMKNGSAKTRINKKRKDPMTPASKIEVKDAKPKTQLGSSKRKSSRGDTIVSKTTAKGTTKGGTKKRQSGVKSRGTPKKTNVSKVGSSNKSRPSTTVQSSKQGTYRDAAASDSSNGSKKKKSNGASTKKKNLNGASDKKKKSEMRRMKKLTGSSDNLHALEATEKAKIAAAAVSAASKKENASIVDELLDTADGSSSNSDINEDLSRFGHCKMTGCTRVFDNNNPPYVCCLCGRVTCEKHCEMAPSRNDENEMVRICDICLYETDSDDDSIGGDQRQSESPEWSPDADSSDKDGLDNAERQRLNGELTALLSNIESMSPSELRERLTNLKSKFT